jgi:CubicO group peptidase (beta-lactamase class C family)
MMPAHRPVGLVGPVGLEAGDVAAAIVHKGVAPMCAAGWATRGRTLEESGPEGEPGSRTLEESGPEGERESGRQIGGSTGVLFDLASVTKPMTAIAFVRAGLDPRTPLAELLPEVRATASARVPIELLLAHRAGLAAHRALYAPLLHHKAVDNEVALREAADARRPEAGGQPGAEGFAPVYSDLGYILAGAALAKAVGARDAGEAIGRLVLEPLGIADRAGTVRELGVRGVAGPFAPTETVAWRGGPVVGAVHDENAWALTGRGGSGHAGLFGTIDAVLALGLAVLRDVEPSSWLVRERPGGTLRAGFDGKSAPPEASSAGEQLGPRSFGHLGFTGTSLWIDPDAGVVVALLTNRVCPSRDNLAIRAARPWAHDRLFTRAMASSSRG